ncbi:histidine kinase [Myroides ceti]|uniref:Histidine kinase n=1 Tax=Paenimyroides ceti TaxID=395087 RepID=A0ABT8CTR9_9FLAO|nr:histidine kinase [Paenimyroides ceti]MDN3707579.1 histidine kinase [Paenimyroides ceti]MDN3709844.1 histidine kinase [Paenimyroides ceti]
MKTLLKNLIKAVVVSLLICTVITLINFISKREMVWNEAYLRNNIIGFIYGIVLYFVNAYLFHFIKRIVKDDNSYKKRILLFLPLSVAATSLSVFLINMGLKTGYEGLSFDQFIAGQRMSNYIVIIIISLIIALSIFSFYFYRAYKEGQLKNQTTIASNATATFESLKNQLDPHFLFNSLNVLSALIEENPKKAQEFTVSLSKVYRYVLEQKDKNLVYVEEEMDFARLYVSLLQMRFENALEISFPDVQPYVHLKMIPLSLQLLLENAIKHNIVSETKPLKIQLYFKDNSLIVRNNYQKKETFTKEKGIGLNNIINRYALVSNEHIHIDNDENHFSVSLPLISEDMTFRFGVQLKEEELFQRAYERMNRLKEWYVSIYFVIFGFPLFLLINKLWFPDYKWWPYIILFFMVFNMLINGFRALDILGKWERNMIIKQINKK